jgi:tripeptidyl-peptidase-2
VRWLALINWFTRLESSLVSLRLCLGGFLLEVCIAKWWANLGNCNISFNVTFHGVIPDSKSLVFHAAEGITRVEVTSPLHGEEVS